jgi:hypothetical protein
MLSRTHHASVAARAASMRRLRRRTTSTNHLYCRTNGCASFLDLNVESGIATCPVCGYIRRLD